MSSDVMACDAPCLLNAIRESGRLIVAGPLNNAYEVTIAGLRLFVRERVVVNAEYGQQFAAERHLMGLLGTAVRVPRFIKVILDHSGGERFALFEFVAGTPPDWSDARTIRALADTLAAVHVVAGRRLGNITGPFSDLPVRPYLAGLMNTEAFRLTVDPALGLAVARFADSLDIFDDEPIVLCHGDVHPGNFLTGIDAALWTLDWEACRYRVAAADFNQIAYQWMDPHQEQLLLDAYCDRTGRDGGRFREQVRALRLLWHIRTFNFYVNILHQDIDRYEPHLTAARGLVDR